MSDLRQIGKFDRTVNVLVQKFPQQSKKNPERARGAHGF